MATPMVSHGCSDLFVYSLIDTVGQELVANSEVLGTLNIMKYTFRIQSN